MQNRHWAHVSAFIWSELVKIPRDVSSWIDLHMSYRVIWYLRHSKFPNGRSVPCDVVKVTSNWGFTTMSFPISAYAVMSSLRSSWSKLMLAITSCKLISMSISIFLFAKFSLMEFSTSWYLALISFLPAHTTFLTSISRPAANLVMFVDLNGLLQGRATLFLQSKYLALGHAKLMREIHFSIFETNQTSFLLHDAFQLTGLKILTFFWG